MNSEQIRENFISFFKNKEHLYANPSSLVIKNDPTLMFVNAGMNQFKDIFLGNIIPKNPKAVNSQRCLRVSGKHNDLDEVGHDTYHHTMFEMLGTWSFGDYFKKEAILWSWEFLTECLKIDKDRLYVTIFSGNEKDKLNEDEESKIIWSNLLPENRIISCAKEYNFWEMGSIGPCGPCSEIHIDLRSNEKRAKVAGDSLINKDDPEVIELWNLVFMEFNRKENGDLENLSKKHVDTGMGFERLCMVLQKKRSTYDTDIFSSLISHISKKSNFIYGENLEKDIAIRVIVDHIRAISFAISDGQMPSNVGAGYVIRRILRRAVRYGFSFLNFKTPFLYEMVEILFDQFFKTSPQIKNQIQYVTNIILEEEKSFFKTLERGSSIIENIVKNSKTSTIDSIKVFELYDTYGFPKDLTSLILKENGMSFSEKDFIKLLNQQKERSKLATSNLAKEWVTVNNEKSNGFLGYEFPDTYEREVKVLMYREVDIKGKKLFQIVFNETPFYPEGGGQVGDVGFLKHDNSVIKILDTKKENNLIHHLVEKLPENLESEFILKVDTNKRKLISMNHTATHLLHRALKTSLGDHVEQKGSLVNSKYLRFDFSHFEKLDNEKIIEIEKIVNDSIFFSHNLEEKINVPISEAKKMGAIALFGEKYNDTVRIIKFHESIELCGGTHVKNTSQIGLFKIISESSIASGVRRIEAVTSLGAINYFNSFSKKYTQIGNALKNIQNPLKSIENLISENKNLKERLEVLEKRELLSIKKDLVKSIKKINDLNVLVCSTEIESKSLKNISFEFINNYKNFFLAIFSIVNNKVIFNIGISRDLITKKKWNASELIKRFSVEINGSGGGQDFFASASGTNTENINLVMNKIISFLKSN